MSIALLNIYFLTLESFRKFNTSIYSQIFLAVISLFVSETGNKRTFLDYPPLRFKIFLTKGNSPHVLEQQMYLDHVKSNWKIWTNKHAKY